MCFGTDCPTCSKKSWRGCGRHIPQALSGVPESEWCTCEPRVTVDGKEYPPAAKSAGIGSFVGGLFGGGAKNEEGKKNEL